MCCLHMILFSQAMQRQIDKPPSDITNITLQDSVMPGIVQHLGLVSDVASSHIFGGGGGSVSRVKLVLLSAA